MKEIIVCVVIWITFSVFINLFIVGLTNFAIKINLPKHKKFLNKKDPIYKLIHSNDFLDNYFGYWAIAKYSLAHYIDIEDIIRYSLPWTFFIIPIPIVFLRFTYREEGFYSIPGSKEEDLLTINAAAIEEIYESGMKKRSAIKEQEIDQERLKKNKLQSINKEFTENYIK